MFDCAEIHFPNRLFGFCLILSVAALCPTANQAKDSEERTQHGIGQQCPRTGLAAVYSAFPRLNKRMGLLEIARLLRFNPHAFSNGIERNRLDQFIEYSFPDNHILNLHFTRSTAAGEFTLESAELRRGNLVIKVFPLVK